MEIIVKALKVLEADLESKRGIIGQEITDELVSKTRAIWRYAQDQLPQTEVAEPVVEAKTENETFVPPPVPPVVISNKKVAKHKKGDPEPDPAIGAADTGAGTDAAGGAGAATGEQEQAAEDSTTSAEGAADTKQEDTPA